MLLPIEMRPIFINRSPACWWAEPHLRQSLSTPLIHCNHVLADFLELTGFQMPISQVFMMSSILLTTCFSLIFNRRMNSLYMHLTARICMRTLMRHF